MLGLLGKQAGFWSVFPTQGFLLDAIKRQVKCGGGWVMHSTNFVCYLTVIICALLGCSAKLKAVNMCYKLLENERKLNFPYKKTKGCNLLL